MASGRTGPRGGEPARPRYFLGEARLLTYESIILTWKANRASLRHMNTKRRRRALSYTAVDLGGIRYAIVPEAALLRVCEAAGTPCHPTLDRTHDALRDPPEAGVLAARLVERRRASGLSQVELARRAGVRVETLNRIERGRTTPDFSTIRKLVRAMNRSEAALR